LTAKDSAYVTSFLDVLDSTRTDNGRLLSTMKPVRTVLYRFLTASLTVNDVLTVKDSENYNS